MISLNIVQLLTLGRKEEASIGYLPHCTHVGYSACKIFMANITRKVKATDVTSTKIAQRFNKRHNNFMAALKNSFSVVSHLLEPHGISYESLLAIEEYDAGAGMADRLVMVLNTQIGALLISQFDPKLAVTMALEWGAMVEAASPTLAADQHLIAAHNRADGAIVQLVNRIKGLEAELADEKEKVQILHGRVNEAELDARLAYTDAYYEQHH